MPESSEFLTSAGFADLHRVSARRIRALVLAGRIPGAFKHGRDWLIPAQAKIAMGTRGPLSNSVRRSGTVRAFKQIGELDGFQRESEVATAVKVQAMAPRDRIKWLRDAWGPLQRQPLAQPLPRGISARKFDTMQDKNRYDESQEIAAAVARSSRWRRI
jgi:hypothetical protein